MLKITTCGCLSACLMFSATAPAIGGLILCEGSSAGIGPAARPGDQGIALPGPQSRGRSGEHAKSGEFSFSSSALNGFGGGGQGASGQQSAVQNSAGAPQTLKSSSGPGVAQPHDDGFPPDQPEVAPASKPDVDEQNSGPPPLGPQLPPAPGSSAQTADVIEPVIVDEIPQTDEIPEESTQSPPLQGRTPDPSGPSFSAAAVTAPEPTTMSMLALGLVSLGGLRAARRRK